MLMREPDSLYNKFGSIKKKIDSDYNANTAVWQQFWTEATIDTRLEAGDTSLMAELNGNLPNNNRGQWYFNRVRPLLGQVSGIQRKNRKSTIAVPLENGDQETADQWTKILLGIYKRENVYDTLSDSFHQGACITGMNLLHVYLDWQNDPVNGDIKVDNLAYNQFFIDPYFRKLDLSDCQFVWRRSYLSHSAAAALMPQYYDEIMALEGNPTGTGRDGRFQYQAEAYGQTQQNRIAYDEYYYRAYRNQKLLVDKMSGETLDVTDKDNIDIRTFLQKNPQISLIDHDIPTVRMAIMMQDKVFYDGMNSLNIDVYPFIPVVGYYNSMMPYFYSRIQGIARSLRDPQMLLNRRIILSADLAESITNSGYIFKENAIVDVKHLFQTGQGRIIPLKQEASMTDIQQIQPPQIPPSFFTLQETFSKELNMVSGITEENMGQIVDDMASGVKTALRQGAGLTVLEPLFDKFDNSCKMLGDTVMKIVQANWTPGKVRTVLGGEMPAPLFYNKAFGKYHCAMELGFDTETQKQMQFAQFFQLRQLGIMIPDSNMIEAATIQNKQELMKTMQKQAEQAQQLQMQQAQVQMQELQARTELSQARAIADRGLGVERLSRVEENRAMAIQKIHEANKEDEVALLNKVKILKELEDMDLSHIERLINMANSLKMSESVDAQMAKPAKEELNPQPVQNSSEAVDRGQPLSL